MKQSNLPLRIEYDRNNGFTQGGETYVFKFTCKYGRELFAVIARKVEAGELTLDEGREIANGARKLLRACKELPNDEEE